MKLTLDDGPPVHTIRSLGEGVIRIGEREIRGSVVVTASRLIDPWRPCSVDELQAGDFDVILELRPDILLLGTGRSQRFADHRLLAPLHAQRIGVELMDTGAACRTFNVLVAEGRNVAAALMIPGAGAERTGS